MLNPGLGMKLGMGCSRLGSLLAHGGPDTAAQAVAAAVDCGIDFYDTANIYGQGSSELILGKVLPKTGVEVCTKAGFVTPLPLWAMRAAKTALRPLTSARGIGLRNRVAAQRARSYPQKFDVGHLASSLRGSLGRLRRECAEVFLLHGPPPELAESEELWRWVDAELKRGRIGAFGVGVPGVAADLPWLERELLTVVQVPARNVLPKPNDFLRDPRSRRLRVLVNEIVGPGGTTPEAIATALSDAARADNVSVALLGMSSPGHVRQSATLFRGMSLAAA